MATTFDDSRELRREGDLAASLGVATTRVLVPLWLLAGALTKLAALTPSLLPSVLVTWLGGLGVDLGFFLRFTIAVELAAVAVIWLLPSLARPVALAMLAAFFVILVGDILTGASSCGCFGKVQVHPGVTLLVDGLLLAGILLGRRAPSLRWTHTLPAWRVVLVGLVVTALFAIAFGMPRPAAPGAASADGPETTAAPSLPEQGYYLPDYTSWLGRSWAELELAGWVQGAPDDLDRGEQMILLYRKDCEHCHELMELYFLGDLPMPTTVVAVPERDGFPTVGVQPMPCTGCRQAELPSGVDWFFQTPVLIRLADGVVRCVAEEDPTAPECVTW